VDQLMQAAGVADQWIQDYAYWLIAIGTILSSYVIVTAMSKTIYRSAYNNSGYCCADIKAGEARRLTTVAIIASPVTLCLLVPILFVLVMATPATYTHKRLVKWWESK